MLQSNFFVLTPGMQLLPSALVTLDGVNDSMPHLSHYASAAFSAVLWSDGKPSLPAGSTAPRVYA